MRSSNEEKEGAAVEKIAEEVADKPRSRLVASGIADDSTADDVDKSDDDEKEKADVLVEVEDVEAAG